jgi:uncharacterized Zn-finger protein
MEKHINAYPQGAEIKIEFSNMSFKANKNELSNFFLHDYPFFSPGVSPIKSITIDMQAKNPYLKTGTGRIVTNMKDFALFCLKKDGAVIHPVIFIRVYISFFIGTFRKTIKFGSRKLFGGV